MGKLDIIRLLNNFPFLIAIILFSLGCLIVLTQRNLIKKVIGINVNCPLSSRQWK